MTRPPPQDELPDELMERYRRASDLDRSAPSAHVRDAILAHARRNANERTHHTLRASRWKWKAAASLATVALIGVLTNQILRTRQTDSMPPAPQAPALLASRGAAPLAPTRSMMAAAKATDSRFSGALSRNPSTENDQWPATTLAALRSTYPDLYIAPGSEAPVRIAMVLNKDGTVYKSAIEVSSAATQSPSEQLRRSLGVEPGQLEFPARLLQFGRSADQPNDVYVAVAIRKDD